MGGRRVNASVMMTHQYGVPMKESLLCKVLVFLADTPKSAGNISPLQMIPSSFQTEAFQLFGYYSAKHHYAMKQPATSC